MAMQEMVTIRPAELEIAPTFQGSVHECPVNVYRMKIAAQSADSRRFSFAWRSPGNNLICSPQGFIEFDLVCHIPYNFTEAEAMSAICGHVDRSSGDGGATSAQEVGVIDGMRSGGNPDLSSIAVNAGAAARTVDEMPGSTGYRAGLAFGEGDAVGNCIESIQYTVNGASISHQNWHLFKRSLDRCWVPSRVMQRVYHGAGGSWNSYDCLPLSGQGAFTRQYSAATVNTANLKHQLAGARTVEGFTADSGLVRRMKNLYSAITGKATTLYPGAQQVLSDKYNGSSFKLRIRFPLVGGLFNPCWGESGLSRSCPYQRLALAIPNLNQGSLTVLFKDLEKCIVRRLGRTLSKGVNRGRGTLINNSEVTKAEKAKQFQIGQVSNEQELANSYCAPFTVLFDNSSGNMPNLFLTYLRLQAFRRPPEVASFTTYRTQTYLGPQCNAAIGAKDVILADEKAFDADVGSQVYLKSQNASQILSKVPVTLSSYQYDKQNEADGTWKVSFQNLQFAQPPSYIFICAQKDSKMLSHRSPLEDLKVDLLTASGKTAAVQTQPNATITDVTAPLAKVDGALASATLAAGRYIAQNQDSNLSIVRLSILVQSSVGSFQFAGDSYPFLRDQQVMWDEHRRNCCTDYFDKSGFSDWQKRGSCVLLSVSQYLHGLGSSAGVAFPIQITCDVEFQNRCQFIEGLYAYDEKAPRGPMVFKDYINARPVLVGIFDKQVLQIASSSAVLSAQNISQASFSQIVASRQ